MYKAATGATTTAVDKMGSMISIIIPWVLWNVGLIMAIYAVDPSNPRFSGYILTPFGWPAFPFRILLELFIQLEMFYMIVLYWILFFAVFSTVTNHWIRIVRFAAKSLQLQVLSPFFKADLSMMPMNYVRTGMSSRAVSGLHWMPLQEKTKWLSSLTRNSKYLIACITTASQVLHGQASYCAICHVTA